MGHRSPTMVEGMAVREDFRARGWSRMEGLADRWAAPILYGRRAANHAEWQKSENWILGFYFSTSDTRLWVPARGLKGSPHLSKRVLNFGHSAGRPALKILILAHTAGLVFLGLLGAALAQSK